MIPVLQTASYIAQRYHQEFGEIIDEMKLHKLLYFTQRETIIQTGSPLFAELFQAWRYGPVMPIVREHFAGITASKDASIDDSLSLVYDKIFEQYASKSSISLCDLSHGEYSWRHAREGVGPYDPCTNEILLEDIRLDAERIKQRRLFLKRIA